MSPSSNSDAGSGLSYLGRHILAAKRERATFATWRDAVTDPVAKLSHSQAVHRLTVRINALACTPPKNW